MKLSSAYTALSNKNAHRLLSLSLTLRSAIGKPATSIMVPDTTIRRLVYG